MNPANFRHLELVLKVGPPEGEPDRVFVLNQIANDLAST